MGARKERISVERALSAGVFMVTPPPPPPPYQSHYVKYCFYFVVSLDIYGRLKF